MTLRILVNKWIDSGRVGPFLAMLPLEHHEQKGPSQFANELEEIFLSQLPDKSSEDAELIHKLAHSAADPAIACTCNY